jgi:hypothetical protein
MTFKEDDLRELWRSQRPRDSRRADCLTEEDWPRLMAGEMNAAERSRAATHLSTCAACADEYRALHALRLWADEAEQVLLPPSSPREAVGWIAWLSPSRAAFALAAAVVLFLVQGVALYLFWADNRSQVAQLAEQLASRDRALASATSSLAETRDRLQSASSSRSQQESADLRETLARLSEPQLGIPIVDLDPQGSTRGTGQRVTTVEAPEGAQFVTLILNFPPIPPQSHVLVEVFDEGGTKLSETGSSPPSETASLNLTLARQRFSGGTYVIRVSRVADTRREVASYRVSIRYETDRSR